MKKALFSMAIIAFALSTTSCSKDRDCTCTSDGNSETTTFPDASKSDAEDACQTLEDLSNAFSALSGVTTSCELD